MIRLSNYWSLLLLVFIPCFYYLTKFSLAELSPRRKWATFAIRTALVLLLTLSLSGMKVAWKSRNLCVLFTLDVSESVAKEEIRKALTFIEKATSRLKEGDMTGLVVFARDACVEVPPAKGLNVTKIYCEPLSTYTDISKAIRTSVDIFPRGLQRKVILMTDGNENLGNVREELVRLQETNNLSIYTVPLLTKIAGRSEAIIQSLVTPSRVALNSSFRLKAVIWSNVNNFVNIKLFKDGIYVAEQNVEVLPKEKKIVEFRQSLEREGVHVYEAIIQPLHDTIAENNRCKAVLTVIRKPRVLILIGDKSSLLPEALRGAMDITVLSDPTSLPSSLLDMQDYSSIILDNVPARSLTEDQMKLIERYVHDLGGGFVMVGGENSFGNGGYAGTSIERILPVKMIPEEKKRSLSIVVLIDKSGSMASMSGGYSKIDLAKEASISVLDMLSEKDKIGIIAFDAKAHEIFKLSDVRSKAELEERIATLNAKGGTNIFPALEKAYKWLKSSESQLNHVIILSDGRTLQPRELFDLAKRMGNDNITISTVVISEEADKKLMQDIALAGKGRYYETMNVAELPKIFMKETSLASKLLMEGNFSPIIKERHQIIEGIDAANMPKIYGYVATSPKEGSTEIIVSDQGDPLLSVWQYGLGKALAFTSDASPRWSVEWLKTRWFARMWRQAIGWTMASMTEAFDISSTVSGGKGHVLVDAFDESGRFRNFLDIMANIVKPDLSSENVKLVQTASGRYEGNFSAELVGTYSINITERKDGKTVASQISNVVVSYSPEYLDMETNHTLLKEIANKTDGIYDPAPEEVANRNLTAEWKETDVWRVFLMLAIPIFFADVALRRITITSEEIARLKDRLFPKKAYIETTTVSTITRLKSKREKKIISVQGIKISGGQRERLHTVRVTEGHADHTARLLSAKRRAMGER